MAWVCPKCGHGNLDEWETCASCGLKSHVDFKINEKELENFLV